MTNVRQENGPQRKQDWSLIGVVFLIAVLAGTDLTLDLLHGANTTHLLFEGLVFSLALLGVGILLRRLATTYRQTKVLEEETQELNQLLENAEEEVEHWKTEVKDFLDGLGQSIERQFQRWKLTPAESGIALLTLKGFSHKEIAKLRGVNERTVRQQAHSIYKKAGVSGRHELSSFFLEDLLIPPS